MFDKDLVALIAKAARQPTGEPEGKIDLAQQQHAAIAGERAARKIGDDFSGTEVLK